MISEKVKKYCNCDISKIENYDKAVVDKDETWHCHHRAEILSCGNFSVETLKKYCLYYNRNPEELIFLTESEHHRLHTFCDKHPLYGKHHSAETKRKMSEARKGNKHPLYGKHLSAETKKKISEAKNGISRSSETKRKISEARKGMTFSEETRRKMSLAKKEYWEKRKMIQLEINPKQKNSELKY